MGKNHSSDIKLKKNEAMEYIVLQSGEMNYISTSKLIPRPPLKVELNPQNSVKYTSPCCIHPYYFVALGSLSNVEVMLFHYLGVRTSRETGPSFSLFSLLPSNHM